jgi:regulator of cell morphogenesis and NO signaling
MSTITSTSTVADIATTDPATIRVFQRLQIDFCCGGKVPLADVCRDRGLDPATVLAELHAAGQSAEDRIDWRVRPLVDLVIWIQSRFHEPLRDELPRLSKMLAKVIARHGDRLPDTLRALRSTFDQLQTELLEHMAKEDAVLFPAIVALESGAAAHRGPASWEWLQQPIAVMEQEHENAGADIDRMRRVTRNYTPPEWACPTFLGLYHGLHQLEQDMHEHVHLENHILFPRAAALALERSRQANAL